MSNLIDFHIHIDYYKNYREMYNYFNLNRIYALFVTNLPEIYHQCIREFPNSKYVRIALGYNPQMVKTHKLNKSLFDDLLPSTNYVGEVGLDYTKHYIGFKIEQQDAFRYICKKASEMNKIMSIHSRKAEEDTLNILRQCNVRFAVFHWYSGKITVLNEIIESGYYFSVNYSMLSTANGLKIIEKIPLDKLLIETDGPFGKNSSNEKTYNLQMVYDEFERKLNIGNIEFIVFNNLKRLITEQQNY